MHERARARARVTHNYPTVRVPNEFTFSPKLRQNINDGPLMGFPFDVHEERKKKRKSAEKTSLSRVTTRCAFASRRDSRARALNFNALYLPLEEARAAPAPRRTNSPQSPRQFVVIHIRLGLPLAPSSRHLVGIGQLELAVGSFPRDARGVTRVRQELEQKLPELNLTGTGAREPTARRSEHLVGICEVTTDSAGFAVRDRRRV